MRTDAAVLDDANAMLPARPLTIPMEALRRQEGRRPLSYG
jgi:hypothetical protein